MRAYKSLLSIVYPSGNLDVMGITIGTSFSINENMVSEKSRCYNSENLFEEIHSSPKEDCHCGYYSVSIKNFYLRKKARRAQKKSNVLKVPLLLEVELCGRVIEHEPMRVLGSDEMCTMYRSSHFQILSITVDETARSIADWVLPTLQEHFPVPIYVDSSNSIKRFRIIVIDPKTNKIYWTRKENREVVVQLQESPYIWEDF